MIYVKERKQINRSAPHPTSKPIDNFFFSDDVTKWYKSTKFKQV